MTLKKLQSLCRYYQKLFRLQDFDVRLEVRRQDNVDFGESRTIGTEALNKVWGISKINILDQVDFYAHNEIPVNQEHVLIHELLELKMRSFLDDIELSEAQAAAKDLFINTITTVILNLRGK